MKTIKKILNKLSSFIDIIFFIILIPSAITMRLYKIFGSHKLPFAKNLLNYIGVFPIINHYHEPQFIFNKNDERAIKFRNLLEIDLNLKKQIKNLSYLNYSNELVKLNLKRGSINYNFNIKNKFFENGDAEIYYQIIRYLKPKNILEIGSGNSTLIAMEAIKKNIDENKKKTNIICVEPYENQWLENLNIKILRKKIEHTNKSLYLNLKKGDLLFIDSSHIIRPQGDVTKIYLEILPKLNSGVFVHIHDIFTPKDYPEKFLIEENKFWNEQYLFEALILNKKKYEIFLFLNFLKNNAFKTLKKSCPYLKKIHEPKSVYIKIK